MKSFIGKESLKDAMGLMKRDLSKKEDIVSDFTDAQVAEMYGSTSGTQDFFNLIFLIKNYNLAKPYEESIINNSFISGGIEIEEYEPRACYGTMSLSDFRNTALKSLLETKAGYDITSRDYSIHGYVYSLIPRGFTVDFHISYAYTYSMQGASITNREFTSLDTPDENFIFIANKVGFVKEIPFKQEGFSTEIYLF